MKMSGKDIFLSVKTALGQTIYHILKQCSMILKHEYSLNTWDYESVAWGIFLIP